LFGKNKVHVVQVAGPKIGLGLSRESVSFNFKLFRGPDNNSNNNTYTLPVRGLVVYPRPPLEEILRVPKKHLLCCRFLVYEVGLTTNSEAVRFALRHGDIDFLKLLFDRGSLDAYGTLYPTIAIPKQHKIGWIKFDLKHAARKGFADCIAFVVDQGCPWCPEVRGSNLGQLQDSVALSFSQMVSDCEKCFMPIIVTYSILSYVVLLP
jgi:hypothetical protein